MALQETVAVVLYNFDLCSVCGPARDAEQEYWKAAGEHQQLVMNGGGDVSVLLVQSFGLAE